MVLKLSLAGYVFEIHTDYEYLKKLGANYITDDDADFIIKCTDEELETERLLALEDQNTADEMIESLAIFRKVCEVLADKDGFMMHSAVIEYEGNAIAFLAQSGVGKSTHITNWKKAFNDKVKIINGDKPIIIKKDGEFFACGMPWAGKECWERNVIVPLKAICFLARGEINSCVASSLESASFKLMHQIHVPPTEESATRVLDNLDEMLKKVKIFDLKCNQDVESAIVAKQAILGDI